MSESVETLTTPQDLTPDPQNANKGTERGRTLLEKSLEDFGAARSIVVDRNGVVLAGNKTLEAAVEKGFDIEVVRSDGKKLVVVQRTDLDYDDPRAKGLAIADNRVQQVDLAWDAEVLAKLAAEDVPVGDFFLPEELAVFKDMAAAQAAAPAAEAETPEGRAARKEKASGALARRFGVPPFSVLDARQAYWQERKRAWLDLGIQSETGRKGNLLNFSEGVRRGYGEEYEGGNAWAGDGTSVFDPVLCELAYRWYCKPGGRVLDPFAGGSVRGIVAARLGLYYLGFELRPEQVEANEKQAAEILSEEERARVRWVCADSRDIAGLCQLEQGFDLLFSCPPYYDLERYSDDPADLSNAESYESFKEAYGNILLAGVTLLSDPSCVVLVVSEIRDEAGRCRGFVRDTEEIVESCGMPLYNEAVLMGPAGTAALRAGRITVVRDDKVVGGSKARFLPRLLAGHSEIVYGAPFCGGAPVAIAAVAGNLGVRATIFYAKRSVLHRRQLQAQALGAYLIPVPFGYMSNVQSKARSYASATGALFLPLGIDLPEAEAAFIEALKPLVGQLDHPEVWCATGSGFLARCLARLFPRAVVHGVTVGLASRWKRQDFPSNVVLHDPGIAFEKEEKSAAPFPSCPNYDRKAWRMCERVSAGRVLFWNVLG